MNPLEFNHDSYARIIQKTLEDEKECLKLTREIGYLLTEWLEKYVEDWDFKDFGTFESCEGELRKMKQHHERNIKGLREKLSKIREEKLSEKRRNPLNSDNSRR